MTDQLDLPAGPPIHMRRDRMMPSAEFEQLVTTQRPHPGDHRCHNTAVTQAMFGKLSA